MAFPIPDIPPVTTATFCSFCKYLIVFLADVIVLVVVMVVMVSNGLLSCREKLVLLILELPMDVPFIVYSTRRYI